MPQEALLLSPLRIFKAEHLSLMAQIKRIREACDNLSTGAKSFALIRLIYMFLALEKDLNEHVHLENNLLFPNLLRLGQQIKGQTERARLGKMMVEGSYVPATLISLDGRGKLA